MEQAKHGFITSSIRFPFQLISKIDEKAQKEKRSRNFIVTEIVEEYFGEGKKDDNDE